jgi:hypothetical protein
VTIQPVAERVARFLDPDTHLVRGTGSGANGKIDVCFLQAADWLAGGNGTTDAPECVDLVIRSYGRALNDVIAFAAWRDELKPYALRIIGTAGDASCTARRLSMCADWAVRTIAPMAFDAWAARKPNSVAAEWAARLRAVAPIVDSATMMAGNTVADAASHAASARAASAGVAADAAAASAGAASAGAAAAYDASAGAASACAYAADAASAGAAAAYAASACAYAADAASAGAASAHAASRVVWDEALTFLSRLIEA